MSNTDNYPFQPALAGAISQFKETGSVSVTFSFRMGRDENEEFSYVATFALEPVAARDNDTVMVSLSIDNPDAGWPGHLTDEDLCALTASHFPEVEEWWMIDRHKGENGELVMFFSSTHL